MLIAGTQPQRAWSSGVGSVRKRWFVDGEPAPFRPEHGEYLKPAMNLLKQVQQRKTALTEGGRLDTAIDRKTDERGVTITAYSGTWGNEIRIDVPSVPVKRAEPTQQRPVVWVTDFEPESQVTTYEEEPPLVPTVHVETKPDEPEITVPKPPPVLVIKPPKERLPQPYLWVGFKVRDDAEGRGPDGIGNLAVCAVWEPFDKKKGKDRGIVSTYPVLSFDASQTYGLSVSGPLWAETNTQVPEHVRPRWWDAHRQANVALAPDGFSAVVQVTREGGLYMVTPWLSSQSSLIPDDMPRDIGITFPGGGDAGFSMYGPFDPELPEEGDPPALYGVTPTPDSNYGNVYDTTIDPLGIGPQDVTLSRWDAVAVLSPEPPIDEEPDPAQPIAEDPSDRRKILSLDKMYKHLDINPTAFPGEYIIKVGAVSTCVHALQVEIEVRALRPPDMVRESFLVVVPQGADVPLAMHPYGFYNQKPFDDDVDENGMRLNGLPAPSKNWWSGAILVDVNMGTIKKVDSFVPPHGFADDQWWIEGCLSAGDLDIYVEFHGVYSGPWLEFFNDALALTVTNARVPYPWQAPQELPPSSTDPQLQRAIDIKAIAAGTDMTGWVGLIRWVEPNPGATPVVGHFEPWANPVVPKNALAPEYDPAWVAALKAHTQNLGGFDYVGYYAVGRTFIQYPTFL